MVDLSIGQLAPDMERAEPNNTDTEDTYTTVNLEVPTGTVGIEEKVQVKLSLLRSLGYLN